jgi:CRP/FNR family transcriptional regulator
MPSTLSGAGVPRCLRRGELLLLQGQPVESLYLVVNGLLALTACSSEGREGILDLVRPGELAWAAWLAPSDAASSFGVRAVAASSILAFPRRPVVQWLERDAGAAVALARRMAEQLDDLARRLFESMTMEVSDRVASFLSRAGAGCLSQGEIAAAVGCSRETVNRVLSART